MSAIGTKRTFCVAAVTYLTSGRDLLREGSSRGTRGAPVVLAAPDFGKTGEPGSGTPEERIEIARRSRDYTVSAGQRIHGQTIDDMGVSPSESVSHSTVPSRRIAT